MMIEIDNLWDIDIKKITSMINTFWDIDDIIGVEKKIEELLDYFRIEPPKKKKELQKLYFKQWSAYQVLLKIAKIKPNLLKKFKKDIIWLARNPDININERFRNLIKLINLDIKNEKCIYLTLDDFNKIMKDRTQIQIDDIGKELGINSNEALDWVKQLIEEKRINAYIANNVVHLID